MLDVGEGDRRKETLFLVTRRPFFSDEGGPIFAGWRVLIDGGDGDRMKETLFLVARRPFLSIEGGGLEVIEQRREAVGVERVR